MWAQGAAIRPVPGFARLDALTLTEVEARLSEDTADRTLDEAFTRFERTQPSLADRVSEVLSRPLDETALALGYFLSIAIWLAFEKKYGARLRTAEPDDVSAVDQALLLEAELRAERVEEPASVDDIIAQEQPAAASFIHEHVDAALDVHIGESAPDVGDVDQVYRTTLVVLLSLSHAVSQDPGSPTDVGQEILA